MPLTQTTSPNIEVFLVTDATTGAPVTGAAGTFTWVRYSDDLGVAIAPPAITEIGNGMYKFTPTFSADGARGVVYLLDLGSGRNPRYYWQYANPEQFDDKLIKKLLQLQAGKWQIYTTGPDINRMVIYDNDGTTVLYKFDLFDVSGNPTAINPFRRQPV